MASDADTARRVLVAWLAARGGQPDVVETHVSVLAFQGDRVYKVKKPVHFDFLDLSTPELRAAACEREVALNRRLASDVYVGVVDVTDSDGRTVEHAVEMRRMPDYRRLSTLVRDGDSASGCIAAIAATISRFHAGAATSAEISAAASRDAVAELWERGFAETRPFVGGVLDAAVVARVETLARRYMSGRVALFDARVSAGRIRDGHGDLLADDVFCLASGPRILDCLEFDDRLRFGDVLGDIAFLAMDLELLKRPDLARELLDQYRDLAADTWPASLEHLYIAYRAHVRAKVACLRSAQGDPDAAARARTRLGLAAAHLEQSRVRLVLIGGLPGTGKSTLAAGLAQSTGARLLRSDVMRKEIAGLAPTDRAGGGNGFAEGIYAPAATDILYRALIDTAGEMLALGESVIIDASWSRAAHRQAAETTARATSSDLIQLRCDAPGPVAVARIRARLATQGDASDATEDVAATMAGRFDAWSDATGLDTGSHSAAATLHRVAALLAG